MRGRSQRRRGMAWPGRRQLLAAGEPLDPSIARWRPAACAACSAACTLLGTQRLSREAWWQAALLACGEGAVLSHHTAAQLWSLRRGELFPISVIVPRIGGRKHDTDPARRMPLDPTDYMKPRRPGGHHPRPHDRRPGRRARPPPLRELVERAQDLRRFNPREIRAILERQPRRRPGGRATARLHPAARARPRRRALAPGAAVPPARPPSAAAQAGGQREIEGAAARLRLARPAAGGRGRRLRLPLLAAGDARGTEARDRRLLAAGWRPARFTYEEVAFDPTATAEELRSLPPNMARGPTQ